MIGAGVSAIDDRPQAFGVTAGSPWAASLELAFCSTTLLSFLAVSVGLCLFQDIQLSWHCVFRLGFPSRVGFSFAGTDVSSRRFAPFFFLRSSRELMSRSWLVGAFVSFFASWRSWASFAAWRVTRKRMADLYSTQAQRFGVSVRVY